MWIKNARLLGTPILQSLYFNDDEILTQIQAQSLPDQSSESLDALDLNGDWLSLGGLDLQINGALGLAFPDLTKADGDRLQAIGQYLWEQGVNAYLPTLVTTSIDKIHGALNTLATFKPKTSNTAQILGVHLEGPCLNPKKRGAHPQQYLLPLSLENLHKILGDSIDPDLAAQVKIMTLAPELDPQGLTLESLKQRGIVVSLGHSLATAAEADLAFQKGATMVTHAFNAMPPLHHREPGLLASALLHPDVACGVIADGQHVAPQMLTLLIRASTPKGVFLVSDALSPLGLPDGKYPWDDREIEVQQGTARLPDGTLAGTTHPLLKGVQNLVRWGCCEPEQAIALATETPRHAIGEAGLGLGCPARDLLRWTLTDSDQLEWQRLQLE